MISVLERTNLTYMMYWYPNESRELTHGKEKSVYVLHGKYPYELSLQFIGNYTYDINEEMFKYVISGEKMIRSVTENLDRYEIAYITIDKNNFP